MVGQVVTLHIHVEVSSNKYWNLEIVAAKSAHKVKKLLDIIRSVPESCVIVLAMPRHGNEAGVDVLEPHPRGAVQLQHDHQDHQEDYQRTYLDHGEIVMSDPRGKIAKSGVLQLQGGPKVLLRVPDDGGQWRHRSGGLPLLFILVTVFGIFFRNSLKTILS